MVSFQANLGGGLLWSQNNSLLVVFEFQVGKEFLAGGDFLIQNKTACFLFCF